MSKRKNVDNLYFEYIAKSYVKLYGNELDKEAVSEEVQAFEQPKRPDVKSKAVKGSKISVRYIKYAGMVAAAILVCVMTVLAVIVTGDILSGVADENGSLAHDALQEQVKWQAPNVSLVSTRFEIVDTKEDNGKVVHTVSDIYGDDVVITLSSRIDADFEGMTKTFYDNKIIYVKVDTAYRLAAYEYGDTLVELSCRYDFETLENLIEALHIEL